VEGTIARKVPVMTDEVVGAAALLAEFIAKSNGIAVEEVTPEYAERILTESKKQAIAEALENNQVVDESRSIDDIKNDIIKLIDHAQL